MSWNYRVIEFVDEAGEPWRAIHEVHYDPEGNPNGYGEEPAAVTSTDDAGTNASLSWVLDRMREALDKPVLVERDFKRAAPEGDRAP